MARKADPQKDSLQNLPVELRAEASLRMARRTTYIIAITVLALVAWAAISPVEETAVASGKIVPASSISDVHHFEGGIIDEVLVREGGQVKRGDVLMTLRAEQAAGDLAQLQARLASLKLKQIRLTAALKSREPEFGKLGGSFPKLQAENRTAFIQERNQAREERLQLELAVERIREQLNSAEKEAESLKEQVKLQQAQAQIREQSFKKGYTSKHTMLQARANLEETRQRLTGAGGRIAELVKALEEAKTQLREKVADRLRRLSEERTEVAGQIAEAEQDLAQRQDRVRRLKVTAPTGGIVHSLIYHLPGEVIKPGAVVAQIVPAEGGVMAEVELQPRDIGHVRIGNNAEIKLSNYDPNVVGVIRGEVQDISPTTFENKDGQPFYRVRIALARERLNVHGRELPISPGTTLNAQILTGSKTLLRYMLKPVYQSFDTAFSER